MLRILDIVLALCGLLLGLPVMLLLLLLGFFDTGSPLFFQMRVGRHKKNFVLVKFRTMRPDAAQVATHLADASAITPLGRFLRRSKLDELPQLWNVLVGEMSLVGPRPSLPTQQELIAERAKRGIFSVRPGITGLAQIRGVDMSTPHDLAVLDAQMVRSLSVSEYFLLIFATVAGKGRGDKVRSDG